MQDALGIREDILFKAASGLGGGIGGMHDACGALLGGSIMLGYKFGRGREEIENTDKTRISGIPVGKLYKWFQKEFGSATCEEIRTRFGGGVYYDMRVPWQAEMGREAGLGEKCAELTGKTAARVVELMMGSYTIDDL